MTVEDDIKDKSIEYIQMYDGILLYIRECGYDIDLMEKIKKKVIDKDPKFQEYTDNERDAILRATETHTEIYNIIAGNHPDKARDCFRKVLDRSLDILKNALAA